MQKAMNRITLKPLDGVIINESKISFGQTKNDLIRLLGNPDYEEENQIFYNNLDVRFDLDKNGLLEFIECQGPYSENSEFNIYGINPFKLPANELVTLLTNKNDGEIDDFEVPYSYSFLEISVGVWRATVPTDIAAAIAEMKADGSYEAAKEVMDQDLEKSGYFWTVAVGKVDYYKI
ncbi:hypothetical protein AB6805_03160 [Chitinophaga sp. RCC_12]